MKIFINALLNRKHLEYEAKLIDTILHVPKISQNIPLEAQINSYSINSSSVPLQDAEEIIKCSFSTENNDADKNDKKKYNKKLIFCFFKFFLIKESGIIHTNHPIVCKNCFNDTFLCGNKII